MLTENQLPTFIMMFIAGAILAAVYLAGLWITVRRIHVAQHPATWMIMSLLLRMAFVIAVFYSIIAGLGWQHLLVALTGFVALRALAVNRMRPQPIKLGITKESRP
jgi:F1F0 ATPase subunit 2